MYAADLPGDDPQKTQTVVGGFLEGVEVPLPTYKGGDTPSIEGALDAPPEAMLI
jgi:hypothetical protein